MKKLLLLLVLLLWGYSGYVGSGYERGHLYHLYPAQNNNKTRIFDVIEGPLSLLASYVVDGLDYYDQRDHTCQERWEAFEKGSPVIANEGAEYKDGKHWFVNWANTDCMAEDLK